MNGVFDIQVVIPSGEMEFKLKKSAIRMWIHDRDLDYNIVTDEYHEDSDTYVCTYTLYDADAALLFKLTWGGNAV